MLTFLPRLGVLFWWGIPFWGALPHSVNIFTAVLFLATFVIAVATTNVWWVGRLEGNVTDFFAPLTAAGGETLALAGVSYVGGGGGGGGGRWHADSEWSCNGDKILCTYGNILSLECPRNSRYFEDCSNLYHSDNGHHASLLQYSFSLHSIHQQTC